MRPGLRTMTATRRPASKSWSRPMVIPELGLPMALHTRQFMGTAVTGLNHPAVDNEKSLKENRAGRHLILPTGDPMIEAIGEEGDCRHDSMMRTQGSLVVEGGARRNQGRQKKDN